MNRNRKNWKCGERLSENSLNIFGKDFTKKEFSSYLDNYRLSIFLLTKASRKVEEPKNDNFYYLSAPSPPDLFLIPLKLSFENLSKRKLICFFFGKIFALVFSLLGISSLLLSSSKKTSSSGGDETDLVG